MLRDAYENKGQAYDALDKAHEDYSNLVEETVFGTEVDNLDMPFCLYLEAQMAYSTTTKKRERALSVGSHELARSRVTTRMQVFKGSCEVLSCPGLPLQRILH